MSDERQNRPTIICRVSCKNRQISSAEIMAEIEHVLILEPEFFVANIFLAVTFLWCVHVEKVNKYRSRKFTMKC